MQAGSAVQAIRTIQGDIFADQKQSDAQDDSCASRCLEALLIGTAMRQVPYLR